MNGQKQFLTHTGIDELNYLLKYTVGCKGDCASEVMYGLKKLNQSHTRMISFRIKMIPSSSNDLYCYMMAKAGCQLQYGMCPLPGEQECTSYTHMFGL